MFLFFVAIKKSFHPTKKLYIYITRARAEERKWEEEKAKKIQMSERKRRATKKTDGIEKNRSGVETKPRKKRAKVPDTHTVHSNSTTTITTTTVSTPDKHQQQQQQQQQTEANDDLELISWFPPSERTRASLSEMVVMRIALGALFGADADRASEPGEKELNFLCETFQVDHTKAAKVLSRCGGDMDRATDYFVERGERSEARMKREAEKLALKESNQAASTVDATLIAESPPATQECRICREVMKDETSHGVTVLAPCGHIVCKKCSLRLSSCPFCKKSIDQRIKPFF
jgi:hypothetical protein